MSVQARTNTTGKEKRYDSTIAQTQVTLTAEYGKGMYLALRDQVVEAQTVNSGHLKSAGGQPSMHKLQTATPAKDGAKHSWRLRSGSRNR